MNVRGDKTKQPVMKKTPPRALVGLATLALAACGGTDLGDVKYAGDACRRVALVDEATGGGVTGAEDFAFDAEREKFFVSAYDRRAVERAARAGAKTLPEGGLFAVALSDIFNPETEELRVRSIVARDDVHGGLRPHGISYDAAKDEIVFINRAYVKTGRRWTKTPHIERRRADGAAVSGEASVAPCAANDVLATAAGVLTSFDHGFCDWRSSIENIFRLKRSGFSDESGALMFNSAAFANGLARGPDGAVALGATRENAVLLLKNDGDRADEIARVKTPGGPDNLTLTSNGDIIAAVHPSLIRLALNRKLGRGDAPSRIVRIEPATGAVETLFDDNGALFSAATVAVETDAGLVVGSVTDSGLLVCEGRS